MVQKTTIAFMLVLFAVSGCSLFPGCRDTEPNYLVYPGSTLVKTDVGRANKIRIIGYQYHVDMEWRNVVTFYQSHINCTGLLMNGNRIVCEGKANPYGDYSVYIDITDNMATLYTIELSWGRLCQ